MSSAASEGSTGTGASSSSGRSSPDEVGALRGSHAFSPFGAAFPRRSSTPAASFLPPRFWQQHQQRSQAGSTANANSNPQASNLTSGNALHQTHTHTGSTTSDATIPQPTPFSSLPRRTSFGTVLGGGNRLAAFTALGFGPSTPIHSPPLPNSGQITPTQSHRGSSTTTSARDQFTKELKSKPSLEGSAIDTTSNSSMPISPIQKPARTKTMYLPGPDGLLVENRSRRKSQA